MDSFVYDQAREDDSSVESLEQKIADLKARWPVHSVRPSMLQELEDLEDKLEQARHKRPPGRDRLRRQTAR